MGKIGKKYWKIIVLNKKKLIINLKKHGEVAQKL